MLVEDTLRSCTKYLTIVCREETAEHRAKSYRSLVLRRKIRTAVRWITEVDHGAGKGGGPTTRRQLHGDRGASDGGALHQTS